MNLSLYRELSIRMPFLGFANPEMRNGNLSYSCTTKMQASNFRIDVSGIRG